MINRRNLWFVSLVSLILVLSIFYISMPSDRVENLNSEDVTETKTVISESTALVALRVEDDEKVLEQMESLQTILLSETATSDEKNAAYEELVNINLNKGLEEKIQENIKQTYNYDSFVKINNDQVNIVVDNDNNLLLNFKTVSRDNNPEPGENQGGLWNIPGDRFYTIRIRTVLDDNGNESYEIYSMKQPFSVDIMYQINFVTDKFEMINCFNQKLNDLFKARQCYIRPNEHYIPIVIDSVNDETTYSIDERKFFRQSFVIKAMAYIIKKEDFKVEKKPKRIMLFGDGDTFKPKPNINIDEYEDMYHNKKIELMIDFKEYQDKVNFNIDTDMVVDNIILDNIRHFRMFVNDTPYYTDKGFKVNNNDDIKIKIFPIDVSQPSEIKFIGYNPSVVLKNDVPENVSDEKTQNEIIRI